MRAIIKLRLEREASLVMAIKNRLKMRLRKAIFGCFFVAIGIIAGLFGNLAVSNNAIAIENGDREAVETVENVDFTVENENLEGEETRNDENEGENSEKDSNQNEDGNKTDDADAKEDSKSPVKDVNCKASLGAIGWLVCPTTGKIAEAVDWLYEKIQGILVIDPISMEDNSPIYEIWKYCLGLTNIVFVIFLLVVIYSQITGLGINNYGIKKVLPKLIVTAVLVNLSFLICTIAVDISNIIGTGLRGVFTTVEESVIASRASSGATVDMNLSYAQMYRTLAEGGVLAVGATVIAFETGAIWMLIPTVLGAIVSVVSGLITIALRQAVVALLVMISPLAIVAYILPNTEKWFTKWKDLLMKMLIFYPMFSLLFGAANLAGFAIIASAKDGFGLLLGTAVKIFPLFFSWSLMKMSGTFLGTINAKMRGIASHPLAANQSWADSRRQLSKQKHLASRRAYTPSLRLMQFMSNRKVARDAELSEHQETVKNRGLAYKANKNYNRKGTPTRRGERAYSEQADNMEYQRMIARDKNNLNKGFGYLAKEGTLKRARLDKLDVRNVDAADMLFAENERGARIDYENALGRYNRYEDAMNAHFDKENRGNPKYKTHDIKDRAEAEKRYAELNKISEGEKASLYSITSAAAQAYDTQKKIVETKMQKYFELTPPTKDVVHRLNELTKVDVRKNEKAADNIDQIVAGLRVLNQRGDTDLVKGQLDNILDKRIGGGVRLGTHASQALASFLMFEVKDNDPFLRRFGKYINLENARAFNENDRKVMNFTYDEYVKGYHDGERDYPNGRMYAKKDMKKLVEGTSLDNVERTAFSNLDESLKKAYGYDPEHPDKEWKIEDWLKKREEIQTAFEPAFLSASLKWLSGSEQMNSGVKFWTGYELKQKKEKVNIDGKDITRIAVDENGNPVYEWAPVWDEDEFTGHEDEVESYFRRKTGDYLKDQTTMQILGMRTDYRDATMEHMLNTYLGKGLDDVDMTEEQRQEYDKRRGDYESKRAEIQTRYGDKSPAEAEKLRKKDLKALKMEYAGNQVRKVLGETGKLKQIYASRRSGAANNAKDWLRGWVNLDNEQALRKEVDYYTEKQQKEWEEEMRKKKEADPNFEYDSPHRVYDEADQSRFLAEMSDINDKYKDESAQIFFDKTRDQLEAWFPGDYIVWSYEKYFKDNPYADSDDLYTWIKHVLDDLDQYPGNR